VIRARPTSGRQLPTSFSENSTAPQCTNKVIDDKAKRGNGKNDDVEKSSLKNKIIANEAAAANDIGRSFINILDSKK